MRVLVFFISFCIDWFKRCKNLLLCLEIYNILFMYFLLLVWFSVLVMVFWFVGVFLLCLIGNHHFQVLELVRFSIEARKCCNAVIIAHELDVRME